MPFQTPFQTLQNGGNIGNPGLKRIATPTREARIRRSIMKPVGDLFKAKTGHMLPSSRPSVVCRQD